MILLDAYNARVFFSGKNRELRRMFHVLRVKSKDSYFKSRSTISRLAYIGAFRGLSKEEKDGKIEKIEREAKWIRFYDRRSDSFPGGLLPRVESYLQKRGIAYKIHDRQKENPLKAQRFTGIHFLDEVEVRSEQTKSIQNAIAAGRGILHLATNAGKTECACAITSEFKKQVGRSPNVLFLVHRKQLADQTAKRYEKHLGKKVKVLHGGSSANRSLRKKQRK